MNQGVAKCSCKKVISCVGGDWRVCAACLLMEYVKLLGTDTRERLHRARVQDLRNEGIPEVTLKAIESWYPTFLFLDHSGWLGASTISSIKKRLMVRAGIDTNIFKPHATRAAAATAKVKKGVPIEKVAIDGDWGATNCLEEWYIKDVVVNNSVSSPVRVRRTNITSSII